MSMKSFRPSKIAREVLEDIDYGQRSVFINNCIELYWQDVFKNKGKKPEKSNKPSNKPKESETSDGLQDSTTTSSKPQKSSSETEVGAKQTETPSSQNTHNIQKLLKHLST